MVRDNRHLRAHRDHQGEVRRRAAAHPQPDLVGAGQQPGGARADLLEGFFPPAKAVPLLGVTVSGFDSADGERADQVNLDFG